MIYLWKIVICQCANRLKLKRVNTTICQFLLFIYMWVKQCHKPPMTGNGKHTTHFSWWLGDGLLLFLYPQYTHIYNKLYMHTIYPNISQYIPKYSKISPISTMWGPRSIANLVNITPITNNYGLWYANNELVTGANLLTN